MIISYFKMKKAEFQLKFQMYNFILTLIHNNENTIKGLLNLLDDVGSTTADGVTDKIIEAVVKFQADNSTDDEHA